MDDRTDTDLLAALRAGDQESLAVLMNRYHGLIQAACRRQAGPGDADDCVQAVFLILARRPAAAARAPVLAAWLHRTAWFVCQNAQRAAQRRRQAEQEARMTASTSDAVPSEILEHLDDCLLKLPEKQRIAVTLHYLTGKTPDEVANALHTNRNHTYQLLNRGLNGLREQLSRRRVTVAGAGLLAVLANESQAATGSAPIPAGSPSAGAIALSAETLRATATAFYAPLLAAAGFLCVAGALVATLSLQGGPKPAPPVIPPNSSATVTPEPVASIPVARTTAPRATAPATSSVKLPGLSIPAACGVQIKGYAGEKDYDAIKETGIAFVRRAFHWEGIESRKGVYDFSGHDVAMRELRKRGIRVVGCLAFGNKLYPAVSDEPGRTGYSRYAAALADRYKAEGVIWEIWNEPNTKTFWGSQGVDGKGNSESYAESYTNLVRATVAAMRNADPDCTILAGSVSCLWSDSYKWIDSCMSKGMLTTGIDAWSIHPYAPDLPELYIPAYAKVRDLIERHGGPRDFPLVNSERGWSAGAVASGGDAGKADRQARLLVRQQVIDLSCGVHGTTWYEWKNAKEGYGLFNGDEPSPACTAYRTMISQLRGYRIGGRLQTASSQEYVVSFIGPGGAQKLVAWSAPSPDSRGRPEEVTSRALALPVESTGKLPAVNLYGVESMLTIENGQVTLELDGAPQYITVRTER